MAEEFIFRISFESVSAVSHPEFYIGSDPFTRLQEIPLIPDKYWHRTLCVGNEESMLRQYEGLKNLMAEGELIRKVKILRGNVDWEDISSKLGF